MSLTKKTAIAVCDSNYRSEDGYYVLHIPCNDAMSTMPDNIQQYLQCLNSRDLLLTMRRLCDQFNEYMQKLVHKGYAAVVIHHMVSKPDKKAWYVPHHRARKRIPAAPVDRCRSDV